MAGILRFPGNRIASVLASTKMPFYFQLTKKNSINASMNKKPSAIFEIQESSLETMNSKSILIEPMPKLQVNVQATILLIIFLVIKNSYLSLLEN